MKIVGIITVIWMSISVVSLVYLNVASWLTQKCSFRAYCHKEAVRSKPDEYVKAELDVTFTLLEIAFLLGGIPFWIWFVRAVRKLGWA